MSGAGSLGVRGLGVSVDHHSGLDLVAEPVSDLTSWALCLALSASSWVRSLAVSAAVLATSWATCRIRAALTRRRSRTAVRS